MVDNKRKKNYRKPTQQSLNVLKYLWQNGATSEDRAIEREKVWNAVDYQTSCCQTLRDNGFMVRTGKPRQPSTYRLSLTDAGVDLCKWLEREGLIEKTTRDIRTHSTNGNRKFGLAVKNDSDEISDKATAVDISEIYKEPQETEREDRVLARLGQGDFRKNVLKKWGECCCVTGATTVAVIRASHIKPWSQCDNQERLDPENGLPLVATLDALFDRGFITFDQDGKLLVSPELAVDDAQLFDLNESKLRKTQSEKTEEYFEYHRSHVFKAG